MKVVIISITALTSLCASGFLKMYCYIVDKSNSDLFFFIINFVLSLNLFLFSLVMNFYCNCAACGVRKTMFVALHCLLFSVSSSMPLRTHTHKKKYAWLLICHTILPPPPSFFFFNNKMKIYC